MRILLLTLLVALVTASRLRQRAQTAMQTGLGATTTSPAPEFSVCENGLNKMSKLTSYPMQIKLGNFHLAHGASFCVRKFPSYLKNIWTHNAWVEQGYSNMDEFFKVSATRICPTQYGFSTQWLAKDVRIYNPHTVIVKFHSRLTGQPLNALTGTRVDTLGSAGALDLVVQCTGGDSMKVYDLSWRQIYADNYVRRGEMHLGAIPPAANKIVYTKENVARDAFWKKAVVGSAQIANGDLLEDFAMLAADVALEQLPGIGVVMSFGLEKMFGVDPSDQMNELSRRILNEVDRRFAQNVVLRAQYEALTEINSIRLDFLGYSRWKRDTQHTEYDEIESEAFKVEALSTRYDSQLIKMTPRSSVVDRENVFRVQRTFFSLCFGVVERTAMLGEAVLLNAYADFKQTPGLNANQECDQALAHRSFGGHVSAMKQHVTSSFNLLASNRLSNVILKKIDLGVKFYILSDCEFLHSDVCETIVSKSVFAANIIVAGYKQALLDDMTTISYPHETVLKFLNNVQANTKAYCVRLLTEEAVARQFFSEFSTTAEAFGL